MHACRVGIAFAPRTLDRKTSVVDRRARRVFRDEDGVSPLAGRRRGERNGTGRNIRIAEPCYQLAKRVLRQLVSAHRPAIEWRGDGPKLQMQGTGRARRIEVPD